MKLLLALALACRAGVVAPRVTPGVTNAPVVPVVGLQAIPLLPQSVIGTPSVVPTLTPGLAPNLTPNIAPSLNPTPGVLPSLENLAGGLAEQGQVPGGEGAAQLSGQFFDLSGPRGPPSAGVPSGPVGSAGVSVETVHTAADVERLIPSGTNSHGLKAGLKARLRKMAPYDVYTWQGAAGSQFTGIDLSKKPQLVDQIPELGDHEVVLIKKLQTITRDLQVLVREEGKTPDLMMAGRVTELKSLIGRQVDLEFLVNKANKQVAEHAKRHGLGNGDVAVHLTAEKSVPVREVLNTLNSWQQKTGKVAIENVWVLAGSDVRRMRRGSDGLFREEKPKLPPPVVGDKTLGPLSLAKIQLWTKRGKLDMAHRAVNKLIGEGYDVSPGSALHQAKTALHATTAKLKVDKLVAQNRMKEAKGVWDRAAKSLPVLRLAPDVKLAPTPDVEQLMREIEEPPRRMREKGIRATIPVYGSARILPRWLAQHKLDETLKRVGRNPRDKAGKKALTEARRAVKMSKYYGEAQKFGKLVAEQGGGEIAVVTGNGPGIMEAANKGAFEAGGPSVGFNIILEHEQQPNPYVTPGLQFQFQNFPTRKMALRHGAMALVAFPGGFGTMDELFEVLTLIQTAKMKRVPIVLVGSEYWNEVLDFEELAAAGLISEKDLDLFKIVDTAEEAWAAIAASN